MSVDKGTLKMLWKRALMSFARSKQDVSGFSKIRSPQPPGWLGLTVLPIFKY